MLPTRLKRPIWFCCARKSYGWFVTSHQYSWLLLNDPLNVWFLIIHRGNCPKLSNFSNPLNFGNRPISIKWVFHKKKFLRTVSHLTLKFTNSWWFRVLNHHLWISFFVVVALGYILVIKRSSLITKVLRSTGPKVSFNLFHFAAILTILFVFGCYWRRKSIFVLIFGHFLIEFRAGKLGNSAASATTTAGKEKRHDTLHRIHPLPCDESVMSPKAHGTCLKPVQKLLRWQVDWDTADRICCFNRHYAEHSGYWEGMCIPFCFIS